MVRYLIAAIILALAGFAFTQTFTIFVIQPIGALPEGRTLLIYRTDKLSFIDSPDGVCERVQGYVNLMCRATAMGEIVPGNIVLRMPYSESLYLMSTGGKSYDR